MKQLTDTLVSPATLNDQVIVKFYWISKSNVHVYVRLICVMLNVVKLLRVLPCTDTLMRRSHDTL